MSSFITIAPCLTCQIEGIQCDEARPICSPCRASRGLCTWPTTTPVAPQTRRSSYALPMLPPESQPVLHEMLEYPDFDDPALLRGSPTSFIHAERTKRVFQYMCEYGHNIMRNPVPLVAGLMKFNVFKLGFAMARNYPGQMSAYLAIGAVHLSRSRAAFTDDAQTHYIAAVQSMRIALLESGDDAPPEWACASAAVLSVFEMYHFVNPQIRKAHFLGFHRMMQARLHLRPNGWGPTRAVLEIYIFCLATGATFHREMMSEKDAEYIDDLITLINQVPRPLGPDICGVATFFLSVAYKLAYYSQYETPFNVSPHRFQLLCIEKNLSSWEPDARLLAHPNREKLLVARLYHLACSIWMRKLTSSLYDSASNDSYYWTCSCRAALFILNYPPLEHPPICIGWPLTILGMAATDAWHRHVLRRPIEALIHTSKMRGFQSLVDFLDFIWGDGPGSSTYIGIDAVFRTDLLPDVHI